MSQSSLHVAIIMDGNGRWARSQGLPRIEGHRRGADSVRRVVEAAPDLGISDLTLYAFSSDNWRRPEPEVTGLMRLLAVFLQTEVDRCRYNGVRLSAIGRRDRLPADLQRLLSRAEGETRSGSKLHLRLALDYSSRDAILEAARRCARSRNFSREALAAHMPAPDVDLLIRTASEQRLSDFLLWECAYAEFVFTERMWPDFGADDLAAALRTYGSRQRRFGALPAA